MLTYRIPEVNRGRLATDGGGMVCFALLCQTDAVTPIVILLTIGHLLVQEARLVKLILENVPLVSQLIVLATLMYSRWRSGLRRAWRRVSTMHSLPTSTICDKCSGRLI